MRTSTQASVQAIHDAVRLARKDPVWFRKHVLRLNNDPWQDEILQAFVDIFRFQANELTVCNHDGLNRFSVRSGHGPGKTMTMAQMMHLCGFIRKSQIICTATKFKQVTTRLWPTFRTVLNGAIGEYKGLIQTKQHKIIWAGDQDWYATPETATQPENLQGYHPLSPRDFMLVLIDEASGIKQELFPALFGALSKSNSALAMIGNPTQNQGEFYESHNKPNVMKLYYRKHVTPEESSHMDKKWYQEGLDRYGKDSPIFKVRYRGEYAEDATNQLIPSSHIMRALDAEKINDGSHPILRISVDVADGGIDESIIDSAHMYETHTHFLKMLRRNFPAGESPVLVADAAEDLFKELGGRKDQDEFVVDSLGVGAGTAGTLMSRGYRVIMYKGGESSSNSKKWRNRRVQSFMVLRDEFARVGAISFSDNYTETEEYKDRDIEDMVAQLCWIRTKPGIEKVEDLQTKQELIRETGKSPDLADVKAMMFATKLPSTGSSMLMNTNIAAIGEMESANASW